MAASAASPGVGVAAQRVVLEVRPSPRPGTRPAPGAAPAGRACSAGTRSRRTRPRSPGRWPVALHRASPRSSVCPLGAEALLDATRRSPSRCSRRRPAGPRSGRRRATCGRRWSVFTDCSRLWALPQAEDSLFSTRKNTLRSKSSSLLRSTPGRRACCPRRRLAAAWPPARRRRGRRWPCAGSSADFLAQRARRRPAAARAPGANAGAHEQR